MSSSAAPGRSPRPADLGPVRARPPCGSLTRLAPRGARSPRPWGRPGRDRPLPSLRIASSTSRATCPSRSPSTTASHPPALEWPQAFERGPPRRWGACPPSPPGASAGRRSSCASSRSCREPSRITPPVPIPSASKSSRRSTPWLSSPTTPTIATSASIARRFAATFPAPPSRSSEELAASTGIGASGEIRLTSPAMYRSTIRSPMITTLGAFSAASSSRSRLASIMIAGGAAHPPAC